MDALRLYLGLDWNLDETPRFGASFSFQKTSSSATNPKKKYVVFLLKKLGNLAVHMLKYDWMNSRPLGNTEILKKEQFGDEWNH